ncbi:hypothetical protein GYMLUDRAFT_85199 [Collybiopsis luxurians FD-317 M1]|uniref:Uncharacterized protein n=1 Tax=Collybiopsis luxurians FD-317 M1 TaxID=944289 RepID=A0A0D0CPF5_9AGAR|nr:hypothetical protein GYMLUDRAFT_85199 [Collybiopsis luxurians FD-317 M1]
MSMYGQVQASTGKYEQVPYIVKTNNGQPKVAGVDVDFEALRILEWRMFDHCSDAAGPAGNHQWGMDKGQHKNRWNPWDEFAPENVIGYQKRDASAPMPGTNFESEAEEEVEHEPMVKKSRPRPRMIMNKLQESA